MVRFSQVGGEFGSWPTTQTIYSSGWIRLSCAANEIIPSPPQAAASRPLSSQFLLLKLIQLSTLSPQANPANSLADVLSTLYGDDAISDAIPESLIQLH